MSRTPDKAAVLNLAPGCRAEQDVEGWKIIGADGYPITEGHPTAAAAWSAALATLQPDRTEP